MFHHSTTRLDGVSDSRRAPAAPRDRKQCQITCRGFRTGPRPYCSLRHTTLDRSVSARLACPLGAGWDGAPKARSRKPGVMRRTVDVNAAPYVLPPHRPRSGTVPVAPTKRNHFANANVLKPTKRRAPICTVGHASVPNRPGSRTAPSSILRSKTQATQAKADRTAKPLPKARALSEGSAGRPLLSPPLIAYPPLGSGELGREGYGSRQASGQRVSRRPSDWVGSPPSWDATQCQNNAD